MLYIVKTEKDDKLFTPGPTKYNIELKAETPKWSIHGTKRRSHTKKEKTPGCGMYEYKSYIGEGPKYSFGYIHSASNTESSSKNETKFEVPGPGFYPVKELDTGPKYSMYSRNHDSKKKLIKVKINKTDVPGVGAYEIRKDSSFEVPCFKFDKGERNNLDINETILKYPGPNKYSWDLKFSSTSTPRWSFSREERFPYMKNSYKKLLKSDEPGPGAYNTIEFPGKRGPFYSFSKIKENHITLDRDELKKIKQFPSVGKYLNDIQYLSDPPFYSFSHKLVHKEISDKGKITSPGPGKYNPNKEISSTLPRGPLWSWSSSKVNRDEDAIKKNSKKIRIITPGPGFYNTTKGNIPQGPQYSMRPILKKIKIVDFPGPGQYNVVKENSGGPQYTISKSKREGDLKRIEKDNYPGPGSYKIKDVDLVKCFTISKNKRVSKRKDSFPGPGAYKIPSSFDYINNMTRERGAFDPRFKYI